jgi:co-chaperonin GroES (HSP10)
MENIDDYIPMMPGNRLLVRPSDQRVSRGGILLPGNVQGVAALEGTVVTHGPDCEFAEKDMVVTFAPYSKYVVPVIEGKYKDHLVVNEDDVILYWKHKDEVTDGNAD